LITVRDKEGCQNGPAFGHRDGSATSMAEYNNVLHLFLMQIKESQPELVAPTDNIKSNYSFFHTLRRTAKGRAQGANLDIGVQNVMNRWKKIEEAWAKCPQFNMVDCYSHARDLMLVAWRYLLCAIIETA
jgi:hypothetical protein